MIRALIALIVACAGLWGQDGQPVSLSQGPPYISYSAINYYSSNLLIYRCVARSQQSQTPPGTVTVSAISNASPASFSATGHGFGDFASHGATMTPTIKVSGLTGNWSPLNGVWKATVTSANAFTVAVDSSGFGAVTGTVVVTTLAPRWNQPIWAIQGFVYSSTDLVFSGWASVPGGAGATSLTGGSTGMNKTCSSRTSYSYQ